MARATCFLLVLVLVLASISAAGCASSGTRMRGGDTGDEDLDAGEGEDAGTIDAFVPGIDAFVPIDAAVPTDTGTPIDAPPAPIDAGRDAGAPDAAGCPGTLMRCGGVCVDTRNTLAHCGACGRVCDVVGGTESCVGGTCFVGTCDTGRADCNMMPSDGCEATCSPGSCTTSCGTTGTRSCASICAPACVPPSETCNARDDDCDGACESGLMGCRGGVHRSVHPSTGEHFYTRDRSEAACCGFSVETYDYFWVYASATPGLVPLNRCVLANGYHFYTTASGCEGSPGSIEEGPLGWIAPTPTCGATALYRLWNADDGHFYTTSAGERASAIAGGFTDEGVVGYVWGGP